MARLSGLTSAPLVCIILTMMRQTETETQSKGAETMASKATQQMARAEGKAANMSKAELIFAISDCVITAEALDDTDRAHGTDEAGAYRDEASVYRRELLARGLDNATINAGVGGCVARLRS